MTTGADTPAEGAGEATEARWPSDHTTLAAWHQLVPGRDIMLAKLDPQGREVARYAGRVIRVHQAESWVEVEARWTNRSVVVHGLPFRTGDLLLESFSPVLPFNVFAVYSTAGHLRGWYANVTHPTRLDVSAETPLLVWHDLYLDVVAFPDGTFVSVDEDELEESGLALEDPSLHARIVAARDEVIHRLQHRQGSFGRFMNEAVI